MNMVAHIRVGDILYPEETDEFRLGNAVPDLIGMAGTRLIVYTGHLALYKGVRLHLDTDQVLKGDPLIIANHSEFRQKYKQVIPDTVARPLADIGLELLLDGFIVDLPGALDSYNAAMNVLKDRTQPISKFAREPEKVEKFLDQWSGHSDPLIYQDPEKVAKIIHRRFQIYNRPRFLFDEAKLPEITEILSEQQYSVGLIANQILERTVRQLSLAS
jgi:hypothetical protein